MSVTAEEGYIAFRASVEAGGDDSGEGAGNVSASVKKGKIDVGNDIIAQNDVILTNREGNITVGDTITTRAGDVTLTTEEGGIKVGTDGTKSGEIRANGDVTLQATRANDDSNNPILVDVLTYVGSTNGKVSVKAANGDIKLGDKNATRDELTVYSGGEGDNGGIDMFVSNGTISVYGNTKTEKNTATGNQGGDITMHAHDEYTDKNIVIGQYGKLDSDRDLTLHTYNGGIEVTDDTTAKRNLTVIVDNAGNVTFGENVNVTGNITADVNVGNISVGKDITADKGTVTLNAKEGSIAVGKIDADGNKNGRIKADGNVKITAAKPAKGDSTLVDIVTSVESTGANVNIATTNGHIHIGSNDANTETVTAKGNVNLTANEGKIIIDGKTSTKYEDITMKATNK